jgi:hypothetical protein
MSLDAKLLDDFIKRELLGVQDAQTAGMTIAVLKWLKSKQTASESKWTLMFEKGVRWLAKLQITYSAISEKLTI